MSFSIILGVTEILCGFILVLEGKTGKEIPESPRLEFLGFQQTILLYKMQKTTPSSGWIEEVQQIYLCWEYHWQFTKSPESQISGSDLLFCLISTCKFGSFKNPFATITSLCELYFRFRRFIILVHTKKVISMTMAAAQAAENHGDDWGLTCDTFNEGYIHQFQPERTRNIH